jgi:uncharacterized protein YrrD
MHIYRRRAGVVCHLRAGLVRGAAVTRGLLKHAVGSVCVRRERECVHVRRERECVHVRECVFVYVNVFSKTCL